MDRASGTGRWRWWLVALAALAASGCGEPADSEAAPTPDRPPQRIVSLSPTATEILFALGAGSQVLAVDADSSYPEHAPRTSLSGFSPNTEALAALNPDLVVYAVDPGDLGDALAAIGVRAILQPPAERLEETYEQIRELGAATGHDEQARELIDRMSSEIEEIAGSAPRFARSPTYYHELDQHYFTATSSTFVGEIYARLGLTNIADAAGSPDHGYLQLSAEYIIQADPDLVLLADARCCGQSPETVAARPGWDRLRAVQNGAVIALDDDIASRWGPRVVELMASVAAELRRLAPVIR